MGIKNEGAFKKSWFVLTDESHRFMEVTEDYDYPISRYEGVAIGEKNPAKVRIVSGSLSDDRLDFRYRTGPKLHIAIHGTKCATIVGATDGSPQDKAVGLAGGPEYHPFRMIKHGSFLH